MEHAKRIVPAAAFAGACVVGGIATAEQMSDAVDIVDIDLSEGIVIKPEAAQPSDTFNDLFDGIYVGGAALGVGVLAKRAGRQVRLSFSKKEQAVSELSYQVGGNGTGRKVRALAGVSLIGAGAGLMTGGFVDIAREVGNSQVDVSEALFGELPGTGTGENFILSNTPTPELANAMNLPNEVVAGISEAASSPEYDELVVAPMRVEWHTAFAEGSENKVQVLAAGLPQEITELPEANEICSNVKVVAAEELGVAPGQKLTVDGLPVTVHETVAESAGVNLLPVIMNNEDFARCLQTNPDQPFNAVLAQGEYEEVQRLLADSGVDVENLNNRVFVVPESEFMANTLQTGKNNVNGFALNAMALGLLFAGAALGNNARTQLANNRRINTMLQANGFDWKTIKHVYNEHSEKMALKSSIVAVPAIIGFDAMTNSGTPGAAMGPNAVTLLCVLGTTWTAARVGTELAVRKEAKREELNKGFVV